VTLAKLPQGRSVDLDVTARGGPEEIPSMFQDSDSDPEDAEREILTNAAPAPGRAGEIEERYGVHISSEPMEFLSHELDTLQDVLSQLPASYYQNDLTFMRMGVVRDNAGNPLRTRYAQILWSSQDGAPLPSTIQLSNLYVDQTVIDYHEGHRFPIRYFKDPALIRDLLLRSVFIHEMAHNYTFQINESFVSMAQTPLVQDWARQFGWTRDDSGPTNTGYAYDCGRSAEAPSGYGTTDVVEDIAESAALYMLSPGQLGRGDDRIRGGMTRTQFLKERMDLDGYTGVVPGSDRPEVEPMCMRVHCDCEAVPG